MVRSEMCRKRPVISMVPFLYFADSRGHSSGLQSREAREIVSYDDL